MPTTPREEKLEELVASLEAKLNTAQQTNAALTADRKRMEAEIQRLKAIVDLRVGPVDARTISHQAMADSEVHRACNRRELELTANPLEMKVTTEYWQKKYDEARRLHELELKVAADQVAALQARLEGAEARARQEAEDKVYSTKDFINTTVQSVHEVNQKWWTYADGRPLVRNKGELLCLIHSEISEAMEGERKDLMDDKLPHRKMAEVELADALIRIFDYCGGFGYDLGGAVVEKLEYNHTRADHTHEARAKANGKKF